MLYLFLFCLFFIAKCLNFCCDYCSEYCCDCWDDCWGKDSDFLKDYKEKQKKYIQQYIKKIEEEKEELKNKIREYLSYIKNQVENINSNVGQDDIFNEGIFDKISEINKLRENFERDNYFVENSIEQIQNDLNTLQNLCREANIITFNDFYKKNEEWEKFLEENGIHEKYEEEKNITQKNFSLENTLKKLRDNFGTYLLDIFKTRLYPIGENGDKYKKEFMEFYEEYNIKNWMDTLGEETLQDFCKKNLQNVNYNNKNDTNGNYAFYSYKDNLLSQNYLYLVYALLTDGDEGKITEEINAKIECNIFSDNEILKGYIIAPLIDSFKNNIVETIKDIFEEQLDLNKDFQKNISENIKNEALEKYNKAIKNLNGEKIELKFYNSYSREMETETFFKDCKLSVLFDYVLSKGRKFYYSDEEGDIVDEELEYVNYNDEKERLELKTVFHNHGESLNNAINNRNDITIGEFYKNQIPNVCMLFKVK